MRIQDLFQKPLHRSINGVVKADQKDRETVYQELDEYVVTNELEKHFREIRRVCTDVPVILSSGYSEQEVLDRFAGKGLAAFLKKPYRSSELLATLGTILG